MATRDELYNEATVKGLAERLPRGKESSKGEIEGVLAEHDRAQAAQAAAAARETPQSSTPTVAPQPPSPAARRALRDEQAAAETPEAGTAPRGDADQPSDEDPAPPPTGTVVDDETAERVEAPAGTDFDQISTEELMAERAIIDRIIARRSGASTAGQSSLTLLEQAKRLPVNDRAKQDLSTEQAARKVKLDGGADRVLNYTVRQASDPDGDGVGPAFVVVIDVDGGKHPAKL